VEGNGWGTAANAFNNGPQRGRGKKGGNETGECEDRRYDPRRSNDNGVTVTIVKMRIAARVVEAVSMPPIVIAVLVINPDSSSLAVPGRLRAAPVLGRIDRERSQQQQQHGGYCNLPICSHVQHSITSVGTQRPSDYRVDTS
jgi:hypothetical protein